MMMSRSKRCLCGRDKTPKAEACDACSYLDGRTKGAKAVISAMRDMSGVATLEGLAATTGTSTRAVWQVMMRLCDIGRAVPVDAKWAEARRFRLRTNKHEARI